MNDDVNWSDPTGKTLFQYYLDETSREGGKWQTNAMDRISRITQKMRSLHGPLRYLEEYVKALESGYLQLQDAGGSLPNSNFVNLICEGLNTTDIYDHLLDKYRLTDSNTPAPAWSGSMRTLRAKAQTVHRKQAKHTVNSQ